MVAWLNATWHQTNSSGVPTWHEMNTTRFCAPMNLIVPENVMYILVVPVCTRFTLLILEPFLCLVVLALLLIIPPPRPPQRNELEMSLLVERFDQVLRI